MKKVSILGCGWVGKALADVLAKEHTVNCLSRDMEENEKAKMYDCDVFIIAIPPRDNYLEVLEESVKQLHAKTQVILLSSISFYDGKTLVVQAESLVHSLHNDVVILRLGGLMGYDRIAGKYTAGKVLTSDTRTNYIHRDDVLEIILCVIAKDLRGEAFKVVAPLQSTKKVLFDQNAEQFGFEKTDFLAGDEEGKVLSPKKLCERLGYTFLKEDVLEFWQPALV
ncbi:MAG: hypothetical protein GQ531_02330 [Sulfurovum sp.]|nr:hypothetical protein [Sulfurovum sp.]